jgi:type IV secretory pathway VirJ component
MSVRIGSGHHFSGDYAALAQHIASFADHAAAR